MIETAAPTTLTRITLLIEAAFPFVASQTYIWIVPRDRPRWLDVAFGVVVALVVWVYVYRRGIVSLRTFGLARDGAHRSALPPIALFTLVAVGVLLLTGWLSTGQKRGGLRLDWDLLGALATYPIWGFLQQGMLFGIAYPRLRLAGGERLGIAGVVALFIFAHAPNPILMAGTGVMALVFALVWQKAPSLPVLAISHGILGAVADKALHISMRVGSNYLG
jgi:membrane protease YdiL (CAAX protease family)